jgi:hypothetical protein
VRLDHSRLQINAVSTEPLLTIFCWMENSLIWFLVALLGPSDKDAFDNGFIALQWFCLSCWRRRIWKVISVEDWRLNEKVDW